MPSLQTLCRLSELRCGVCKESDSLIVTPQLLLLAPRSAAARVSNSRLCTYICRLWQKTEQLSLDDLHCELLLLFPATAG